MLPLEKPSLYDRLGGVYSIATVVDDLIDRVMSDARLNANPLVDEAHHRVPPAGFKYLVTEMVCWATGGPQKYSGKSMAESHAHLKITAGEWEAFLDDFQQTLDKCMLGEELNAAEVSDHGFLGDRAYALIDSSDGKVASAKNPRKWPNLFACRATLADVPTAGACEQIRQQAALAAAARGRWQTANSPRVLKLLCHCNQIPSYEIVPDVGFQS